MSTWTTPATWINGAVSAATMNTEVRDHLNWLKGFADLVTNATASDVGTGTLFRIVRANSTDSGYSSRVTGDTQNRVNIDAGGAIRWSSGSVSEDVRLRRSVGGGGVLVDDGAGGGAAIEAVGSITAGKGTADEVILQSGFIELDTRAGGDPVGGAGGRARIYARANASSKVQLCVRMPTGAIFVVYTEP